MSEEEPMSIFQGHCRNNSLRRSPYGLGVKASGRQGTSKEFESAETELPRLADQTEPKLEFKSTAGQGQSPRTLYACMLPRAACGRVPSLVVNGNEDIFASIY